MILDPRWNPIIEESRAWVDAGLQLQRANGSALHQLIEAYQSNDLVAPDDNCADYWPTILDHAFQSLVIEHDWAAAFANSDVNLDIEALTGPPPFPYCCFECQVSGKRVCLIDNFDGPQRVYGQGENYTVHPGGAHRLSCFVRFRAGWTQVPSSFPELMPLVVRQFHAVLITLDAQVAMTEIVRASYVLNRARERRGKPPIFDYHVINLAHRQRPATLPQASEIERASPRLHFRRGHWRHFETFKTWINWMLVGDPDLGFIDKHYRL